MTASNSWLVAVLLFALPRPVLADAAAPSPPTEEQVQAARVPYHEARELHRQGRLKEALERALDAYRMASTPVTALEAGQLLVEAGRLVEARDVARSVALFPVSPRESDKGREARQEAATLGATLDARIPKVALAGRSPGMDVTLDGKPFPTSDPAAWMGVDPGPHTIIVRAGDHTCTSINLILAETEARTIDLHDVASTCHAEAAAPPVPESPLPLREPPPASLSLGRDAPPSSATSLTEPAAPHPAWRWTGAILAGAGVITVGAGAGLALAAKTNYDAVANQCGPEGCSQSAFDARNNARAQADVATVPIVVGAAAIVGGTLLFLFAPHGGSARASARHPAVGIGPGSLSLSFRFE